jgi:hypothetical protein
LTTTTDEIFEMLPAPAGETLNAAVVVRQQLVLNVRFSHADFTVHYGNFCSHFLHRKAAL